MYKNTYVLSLRQAALETCAMEVAHTKAQQILTQRSIVAGIVIV